MNLKQDNISAIIAVRKGSQRVPNKNIRKFANTNLLELKINQLKRIDKIDKIIVSSDCDNMLSLSRSLGAIGIKRPDKFASNDVPMNKVYMHIATSVRCNNILFAHVTSPLISDRSIAECIEIYQSLPAGYDSVATVHKISEYMWRDGMPLNYSPDFHPRSQDLPNICALNFAICILPRSVMVDRRNIIGKKFMPYYLDEEESIDVDTQIEFDIAEFIYKKKIKERNNAR